MNTKRLLKLADFLYNMGERLGVSEAEAQKHFDLTYFFTHLEYATGPDWTPLNCGSTACAIGWMPKVDPRNWKWEFGTGWPRLKKDAYADTPPFEAAEAYFGIDEALIDYLFLPQFNYETPKQVAKRIRAVVIHGGIPQVSDYDCTIKDPGGLDSATRMLGRLLITAILLGVGFCAGRASAQVGMLDTYPTCPTTAVVRYFDPSGFSSLELCVPGRTTHPNGDGGWVEWQVKRTNRTGEDWFTLVRAQSNVIHPSWYITPRLWDRIVFRYRLCTSDIDNSCDVWSEPSPEVVIPPNLDVDNTGTVTIQDLVKAQRDYFPAVFGRTLVEGEWKLP